jgi:hypothetical protein
MEGEFMKKNTLILIDLLVCAFITFVFFEAMSWYHFGDIPTRIVLIRLIGFFCVLVGISISIIALIMKKRKMK